jgi:hypothetical protein
MMRITSAVDAFQTSRDVRLESALRFKAEIRQRLPMN